MATVPWNNRSGAWSKKAEDSAQPEQGTTEQRGETQLDQVPSIQLRELMAQLDHIKDSVNHLVAQESPKRMMGDVHSQLAALQSQVEEQSARNQQLQDALQEARRDQVALLLNPGVKKLVALRQLLSDGSTRDYDQVMRTGQSVSANDDFELACEQLDEAITAFGFELVEASPGTVFDKKYHYAADTVATSDPGMDKTIAEELAPGFTYASAKKAIFPARVVVYTYDAEDD
ncbi:nucleotide exchange factor GrpE [Corynebacterium cystitidis]|uniref:nucleotide exchange factor GrpE n=1 Tax=Corynebacterium cystitidis TaxID=35757 RepID=UPI00211F1E75|nr:nucleotide exchange factor GrpE [Corynebacterium cystitidis]